VPRYCRHKKSGQAVVYVGGQTIYLGRYGTAASKERYRAFVAELLANGTVAPAGAEEDLTIAELAVGFFKWVRQYYVKRGKPTGEVDQFRILLKLLRSLYGRTPAVEFGPRKLKAVRQKLVEQGLKRRVINQRVGKLRRVFKWAAENELLPASVWQNLQAVGGLRKGRSAAPESEKVLPVGDDRIDAIQPFLPPPVWAAVQVQRYTGMRSDEVLSMRIGDLVIGGDVWEYALRAHKTEHHEGLEAKVVPIGPRAQEAIRPFLKASPAAFVFSPRDAERKRNAARSARRKVPISPSNRPEARRKKKPRQRPGQRYRPDTYRRAIARACDLAWPPPEPMAQREDETAAEWARRLEAEGLTEKLAAWRKRHRWHPHQLRHTFATKVRAAFGVEAASVALGHHGLDVTLVYAEKDMSKAKRIMAEVG